MRAVTIIGFPPGNLTPLERWLFDRIGDLAEASTDNNTIDIAGAFSLPTYTVTRTIPSSPSTTDLKNVLCTLIDDLKRGGSVRTG